MKKYLFLILALAFPFYLFAEEASPVGANLEALLGVLGPLLAGFAVKYPWLAKVVVVMGFARIVVKPIMSALVTIGQELPDGKAREFLKKLSDSKIYKIVAYFLDWFGSIKLPKKEA